MVPQHVGLSTASSPLMLQGIEPAASVLGRRSLPVSWLQAVQRTLANRCAGSALATARVLQHAVADVRNRYDVPTQFFNAAFRLRQLNTIAEAGPSTQAKILTSVPDPDVAAALNIHHDKQDAAVRVVDDADDVDEDMQVGGCCVAGLCEGTSNQALVAGVCVCVCVCVCVLLLPQIGVTFFPTSAHTVVEFIASPDSGIALTGLDGDAADITPLAPRFHVRTMLASVRGVDSGTGEPYAHSLHPPVCIPTDPWCCSPVGQLQSCGCSNVRR